VLIPTLDDKRFADQAALNALVDIQSSKLFDALRVGCIDKFSWIVDDLELEGQLQGTNKKITE
jgi:hypothetical protein